MIDNAIATGFGFIARGVFLTTTAVLLVGPAMVHAQEPCPREIIPGDDNVALIEDAVRGNLRYHEWTISVLEQVTASVSSRLQRPEGSDSKSLTVDFSVVRDGEIGTLVVIDSSGDLEFDEAFSNAVRVLAPFPIDSEYMRECEIDHLPISIEWANGGSLTVVRDAGPRP